MVKRKYPKIYKTSEVKLKQVGTFELRGMALPYGTPMYVVVDSRDNVIYPKYFAAEKGRTKESCESWVASDCWSPEDKPFKKSLLRKLMGMHNGEKINDIIIVRNDDIYHGERHSEYTLVFEQDKKHYRFGYVDYFGLSLGKWQGAGLHINGQDYLCKRVYPKERTVKLIDFVTRP
jgi:hypothetical protein